MRRMMLLAVVVTAIAVPTIVACNGDKPAESAASQPTADASPHTVPSTQTSTLPSTLPSTSTSTQTSTSTSTLPSTLPSTSTSASPDYRVYASPIGATFPDLGPATAHISRAACEGIRGAAQQQIDAAVRAASHACTVDTDCVTIHTFACGSDCGGAAISSSAAPSFKRAAEAVRTGKCKAWSDGDCPRTTPLPIPSCPIYVPVCKDGTCSAKMGP